MNGRPRDALRAVIEKQAAHRAEVLAELEALERALHGNMRTYRDGGATQVEVMAASGYRSLDAVRKILDPAVKTKAAAARSRKRIAQPTGWTATAWAGLSLEQRAQVIEAATAAASVSAR